MCVVMEIVLKLGDEGGDVVVGGGCRWHGG